MRKIVFVFVCLVCIATLHAQTLYGTAFSGGTSGKGTICKLDRATNRLTAVFTFEAPDGIAPEYSSLVRANNGKMYGMTMLGGSNGEGTIFSYNPATATYVKMVDFGNINGSNPYGSLIQASDGNLYGMTTFGGDYSKGVLFSYNPSTTVYTKLLDFDSTNGSNPYGSLVQAKDGKLYGMTTFGGSHNNGVIFLFNPATGIYTKLKDFNYNNGDAANPYGNLIQGTDGKLYGMASTDGTGSNAGNIFSFDPITNFYKSISEFNVDNGAIPYGSLIQATDGKLYGMTYRGGKYGVGILFSFNLNTALSTKILDFDYNNGGFPYGNLLQAADGKLYGMTLYGGNDYTGAMFSYNPTNNAYTNLMYFDTKNGCNPLGSLIQATDGKLYGMATFGGLGGNGVIFSYNIGVSTYTKLVDFGKNINGSNALGNLAADALGKLYGMTYNGGDSARGVLFSYNPATATYTKILNFDGNNGGNPDGGLILARDGKLYGMTSNNIFSYDPISAGFTSLKEFDNYTNGASPSGNLVEVTNGKMYGVTAYGGSNGSGVVFSFDPVTSAYVKLIDFNGVNGNEPEGSLIQATNGKLYGMTYRGGSNDKGVLFSFDPATAAYTKLQDFNSTNGSYPYGNLVQAANGKLYGMTPFGGSKDSGVLFSYNPATNVYTTILSFYDNMGSNPLGSLMQASDGKLYGMTTHGGAKNMGVAFSFDPATSTYTKLQDFNGTNGENPMYTFFTEAFPTITIKINNASIQEGSSGQKSINFIVILSKAYSKTITVNYITKTGTAVAPSDYVTKTGTLSFAPGVKQQTIAVLINGDTQVERDEKFKILLSNAVNAIIADSVGIGTILNDDAGFTSPPVESIESNSIPLITVSPNPANSIINVQLRGYTESTTLQLTDMQGKVLKEVKLQTSNMKIAQQSFDVSGIASGTYLIIVLDEKGNKQTRKVVVKH